MQSFEGSIPAMPEESGGTIGSFWRCSSQRSSMASNSLTACTTRPGMRRGELQELLQPHHEALHAADLPDGEEDAGHE